jgi:two-component system response regulator PilR (NtrC family)
MRKPKLLLVDNDHQEREIKQVYFANAGYDVLTSESFQDTKKKILEFGPDYIITDIMMPNGNGFDIKDYVNAHYPDIIVKTASAWGMGEDLTKPYIVADFESLVGIKARAYA